MRVGQRSQALWFVFKMPPAVVPALREAFCIDVRLVLLYQFAMDDIRLIVAIKIDA